MMVDTTQIKTVSLDKLAESMDEKVVVRGWVRNKRDSKAIIFVEVRDGSGFVQAVVSLDDAGQEAFDLAKSLSLETSVILSGTVVKDERQVGGCELVVDALQIVQQPAEDYPLGKKAHGVEFLGNNRHLWLRSKKQWAIMRIRNRAKYAIHTFFQERGFIQMDAPFFTGNACEGTTTLFETDFYGETAYLSQSGQLYGEAMAMALGKIYTFGPTFRAEKSKTRRHLSEFWMIEPEMAYYDLDMNMDLIEEFIKYVAADIAEKCTEELTVLERDMSLFENMKSTFPRITHSDAVRILRGEQEVNGKTTKEILESDLAAVKVRIAEINAEISKTEAEMAAGGIKKGKLNWMRSKVDKLKNELKEEEEKERNIPQWLESAINFPPGEDFGGSDETVLTRMFGTPVFVYKWPKAIKAFYMKTYEDDPEFVKGVDLLAPEGFGEIVGGAEREDNYDVLLAAIKHHELPLEAFEWYLDLRKYGSVPHAGFGLGFERLIMWLTGVHHIRETIPFPRSYGRLFP